MEIVVALSAGLIVILLLMRVEPKKKKVKSVGSQQGGAASSSGVPDYVKDLDGASVPRERWMPEWLDALRSYLGREFSEEEEAAYREMFGNNSQCGWKLVMYGKVVAAGTNCVLAPAGNFYRPLFDKFVSMKLMTTGYAIPPKLTLAALGLDELRRMAERLGAVRAGGKQTLIEAMSKYPEADISNAFDSLNIKRSDLFLADLSQLEANVKSRVALRQQGGRQQDGAGAPAGGADTAPLGPLV